MRSRSGEQVSHHVAAPPRFGLRIRELEDRHRIVQHPRLLFERLRLLCGLFYQCGVLLRHLIHLNHRLIDLFDPARLLFRGLRNFTDDGRDLLDREFDLAYCFPRVRRLLRAVLNHRH